MRAAPGSRRPPPCQVGVAAPPQLCAARRTCRSAGARAAAARRVCSRHCLRGSRAAHAAVGPVGHPQPGAGAAVAHSARPQPGWRAALPRASLPSPARGACPGLQVGSPGRPSGPSSTVHEHLAPCAQAARPEASGCACRLLAGERVEAGLASCPALETLDVQYCDLAPGAAARLRAKLPSLRSVLLSAPATDAGAGGCCP